MIDPRIFEDLQTKIDEETIVDVSSLNSGPCLLSQNEICARQARAPAARLPAQFWLRANVGE
jgi:hypothetical protein